VERRSELVCDAGDQFGFCLFHRLHVKPMNFSHYTVGISGNEHELIFKCKDMFKNIRPDQRSGKTPALA
jgi:hypothetical protein